MSDFTPLEIKLMARVEFLESKTICDSKEQRELKGYTKTHVKGLLGNDDADFRKTIGRLWKDYRKFFDIRSYRDTLFIHYDLAVQFINEWEVEKKSQKLLQ